MGIRISITLLLLLLSALQCAAQHTLREWKAGDVVAEADIRTVGVEKFFCIDTVSDATLKRMQGRSLKSGARVDVKELRYLRMLHRALDGTTRKGEMVCNKAIAADLIDIFLQLYKANYKIENMRLVDDYGADDELSMSHNNTSCFNYRQMSAHKALSKHSRGMAVDVNPLYNPCLHVSDSKAGLVEPKGGKPYARGRERIKNTPVRLINTSDLCYRLFLQHGFRWGGAWRSLKDYQHFEK